MGAYSAFIVALFAEMYGFRRPHRQSQVAISALLLRGMTDCGESPAAYFCSLNCHEEFLDVPHSFVGWADDLGRQRGRRRFRLDWHGVANGGGPVR